MKHGIITIMAAIALAPSVLLGEKKTPTVLTVGKPVPVNRKLFGFIIKSGVPRDDRVLKQLAASTTKMEPGEAKACLIAPLQKDTIPSIIMKQYRRNNPGGKIRAVVDDPGKNLRDSPIHAFYTAGMIISAITNGDLIGELYFDFEKSQPLRKTREGKWEVSPVAQIFSELASFSIAAKSMHPVKINGEKKADIRTAAFSCSDRTRVIIINYEKEALPIQLSPIPRAMGGMIRTYLAGSEANKSAWKVSTPAGKILKGPMKSEKSAVNSPKGKPLIFTLPPTSLTIATIDTPGSM